MNHGSRDRSRGRGAAKPAPGSALKLVQSRVPLDIQASLEAEAQADGRSLANLVRRILEDHVRAQREYAADQRKDS